MRLTVVDGSNLGVGEHSFKLDDVVRSALVD